MFLRLAADLLVLVHLLFILFVVAGGFVALRWPRVAWVHLPAALWGGLIELGGFICPLTPLEVHLRQSAGAAGYSGDFIDHYLIALLYPPGLTRDMQIALGILVLLLNGAVYAVLLRRRWTKHRGHAAADGPPPAGQADGAGDGLGTSSARGAKPAKVEAERASAR